MMTSRKLAAIARRYMRRLEMLEWIPRAEVRVMRDLKDKDGSPCDGLSEWHAEERQCWVYVSPNAPEFMEETLIHELLHVLLEGHLPPLKKDRYDPDYELGLNRLARALCIHQKSAVKVPTRNRAATTTS